MVVPVTVLLNTITVNDRTRPYRSLDVHESPSSGYESFSGTPEAHEHQAEAHATRHHHYDASAQSHEQHHRASRLSYVSYLTPEAVARTAPELLKPLIDRSCGWLGACATV